MSYGFEKTLNNNKILQELRIVLRFAIFYDKQKIVQIYPILRHQLQA